jgi:hypothetical protein
VLREREAGCAEMTRVLVNMLDRMGFDATRLTLYDRVLMNTHTLVSVEIDGRDFLLDSKGGGAWVNRMLRETNISVNDFHLLSYTDDIVSREKRARSLSRVTYPQHDFSKRFFDDFRIYSFEALPITKLLSRMGIDWRVFNFWRPPKWISTLAERPNQILAVFWLVVAILLDVLVYFIIRRFSRTPKFRTSTNLDVSTG